MPSTATRKFSVPAGTYSYTVTDSKSCTATTTGDITQPPTLVPDSSNTEIFCHAGLSTVTVTATGGTAPYSGTGTFFFPAVPHSPRFTLFPYTTLFRSGDITQPPTLVPDSSNTEIF